MNIKAVIFDMDGLMIDSERLYFQTQYDIASRYGKRVPDQLLWRMMGRKPIESMRIFVTELNIRESAEKVLQIRDGMMREKLRTDLVAMPGLFDITGFFFTKIKLAVSTGAPKEFLDMVIDKLGIRDRFSILQASDEIKHGKPDPEIYLKTCKKLREKPSECVVLEDSSNGVLAGKRAGCYVIAVPSEYTRSQDFISADKVVDSLTGAKQHIWELMRRPPKVSARSF